MSFEAILEKIVGEGQGILGVALMESDGIPIAQVHASRSAAGPLSGDIGAAGVEFGRIMDDITKAADALGGGAVRETVVRLARFTLIFDWLEEDVLLVVALDPDGNLGKARYLIRRNMLAIRQEL